MKAVLLIFLFFINLPIFAQNFNEVDKKVVDSYPKKFSSIEKLVTRIKSDFTTPTTQVRALYCWMAHNIQYDVKGLNGNRVVQYSFSSEAERKAIERKMFLETATKTLKEKKAICDGYSKLFKEVCDQLTIECQIVEGFSRVYLSDLDRQYKTPDHAWNAIKIDDQWYLIDATWGAGYLNESMKFVWEYEPIYFMGSPELFFKNHYPMDEKWKFVSKSLNDFENQPLYYLTSVSINTEVISPLSVTLKQNKTNQIQLKTNLIAKNFAFAYDRDQYLTEPKISEKDGDIIIDVTASKSKSKYLTIFYEGKGVISYKVN